MLDRVLAIVLGSALLGFVVYHFIETSALKADLKVKEVTISHLTTAKAELLAENTVLHAANGDFSALVKEQKAAIAAIKKERDDANVKWKAAEAKAAKESTGFKNRIAQIEATVAKAGQSWCDAWKGALDRYFMDRRSDAPK